MTAGQVKLTKADKIEASFNKFTERVKQNLHVIICLNMTSKTLSFATWDSECPIQCISMHVHHHSYAS